MALVLCGCSRGINAPPPDVPNSYPTNYKQVVADFLRTFLNNPTKVKDAYISEPVLKPVSGTNHYVSCVRFNPRDTDNRYQGNEEYTVLYFDGGVNQFLPIKRELCAGAVYQRFPEAESMVP